MRYFVVLCSLFTVGLCGLLPGGYNYNSGSSFDHSALIGSALSSANHEASQSAPEASFAGNGFSGLSSGGLLQNSGIGGLSSNFGSLHGSGSINLGFSQGSGLGGSSGNLGSFQSSSGNLGSFQSSGIGQSSRIEDSKYQAPLITKQFFIHSAPEDNDSAIKNKHFVLGRSQKNYRVIFIKAPSSSNDNVRLSAEYAPQEEKTVIYVLSKKEQELNVDDIATPAPTQPSKPEVFFIKYKTPEEAANAQQEIQKQYDVLGGESQVSNEGYALVSDVSGSLDTSASNQQSNIGYLPPSNNH